ncbi:MAG: methyltransferase [Acidimicrobiales bacterium]|nr:MAG: methyltransferase [Acidimicrobiales bacterium]
MLTVRYDRLGLRPGQRLLDLGCGFGRHAFEARRRGAHVVACDISSEELRRVAATFEAMHLAGEVVPGTMGACVQADATRLPFADATFDRIIAAEVLEHVPDDLAALSELARVLRPGGTIAVTVPAWFPERVCWALSDAYHAPAEPGGHLRIYTSAELTAKLRTVGLEPRSSHKAHGLHTPYWWLRCAVGPQNDTNPLVRAYHRLLVWDIERGPVSLRIAETLLNPFLGKSLVVYATRPVSGARVRSSGSPVAAQATGVRREAA